ncbi:hypothetical protein D3C87_2110020 [compost metagenome]
MKTKIQDQKTKAKINGQTDLIKPMKLTLTIAIKKMKIIALPGIAVSKNKPGTILMIQEAT